jgi:thioester reductase-like protein
VYCLVRAGSDEEAAQRVDHTLRFFALWDDSVPARIAPVRTAKSPLVCTKR